ncbi:MAG: hypothetical protein AAGJ82_14440, partial [Bacteroidota bacterium]
SSNTSGMVGKTDAESDEMKTETFEAEGQDSDGIYYDGERDRLYQVNRSDSKLVAYADVQADINTSLLDVSVSLTSTSNFQNGRGLAVKDNKYIVAQDGSDLFPNKFVIYEETDGRLEFSMSLETNINLWGLRMVGDDLYAVVDNSSDVAIYNDFLTNNNDGQMVMPDHVITIEGLVRTHGIIYDTEDDLMVLTDVGAASSDSDGALFFIENWSSFRNSDSVSASNYTRIAGGNTMLGNPVDVAYDNVTKMAYVAERAREGGLLLAFRASATGDVSPDKMTTFEGASSLFLYRGK